MSRTLIVVASDSGAAFQAQPAGAQTDLIGRFLARYVEHPRAGPRQAGGRLQQQRRFADAGIAAHQHGGGSHKPATQHPVKLLDLRAQARAAARPCRSGFRARGGWSGASPFAGKPGRASAGSSAIVFHSAQVSQRPAHFDVTGAAGLADEAGDGFCHGNSR